MDPLSIAALGWLMSVLVNKAVTTLFEAWAKRMGLNNEFEYLQKQILKLEALLSTARRHRTDNSFLELVPDLEQLVFQVVNLLGELENYRLEDKIQMRGTEENVNCSDEPSAASSSIWKGMSCCSAPDAPDSLPKNFCFKHNLPQRMNDLAKQLKKYKWKVNQAEEKRPPLITSQNTEKSQTEATKVVGRNQDRGQPLNLLKNEESTEVGRGEKDYVYGSTLDSLVAANPSTIKEKREQAPFTAVKGTKSKGGDKGAGLGKEKKVTGQKRGASSKPLFSRLAKKLKSTKVIGEDTTKDLQTLDKSPHLSPRGLANEHDEMERIRKGKFIAVSAAEGKVALPHATGDSPFSQTYYFEEADLVAQLVGDLPPLAPDMGYIWQAGFPPQFPNSVAMHLPGFSGMQNPDDCPNNIDTYSVEMFRANQLPYMVKRMKTNPELAIGEAVSQVFEMGSMLVHIYDDLRKRKGEFFIPEMNHTELARVQMENIWWKNAALSKLRESRKAQDERRIIEQAKGVLEQELSVRTTDMSVLEKLNKALSEENTMLKRNKEVADKRLEEMSDELAVLHQKPQRDVRRSLPPGTPRPEPRQEPNVTGASRGSSARASPPHPTDMAPIAGPTSEDPGNVSAK